MKNSIIRVLTAVLIVFLFAMLLTGCDPIMDLSNENRALCEAMLECIESGDKNGAYELVKNVATSDEVDTYFNLWQDILSDAGEYELNARGWHFNSSAGTTVRTVNYILSNDEGKCVAIQLATIDGVDGIGAFSMQDNTGFAAKTKSVSATNIALIALSLGVLVFVIIMIVDCAKHSMKRKWLWIIIILLGASGSLTVGADVFNLGFNISLIPLSEISADLFSAAISLKISVPVGAIIYATLRKKLFINNAESEQYYQDYR